MPRLLVVYGTTDGHTAKVVTALADTLRDAGCGVDIVEAAGRAGRIGPEPYDGVLVAASVHGGKFQGPVHRWVQMHAPALNRMPTAFIGVCLAVLDKRAAAAAALQAILQRFFVQTGWQPSLHTALAGALLYTRYNWLKRWIMKRIVAKAGGDTDTSRDYEYTDWAALRDFTRRFAALVQERSPGLQDDFSRALSAS